MNRNRRGVALIELIFAMGLGLIVLSVGYRTYATVSRAHQYECSRESVMLTAQNLLGRIKEDVRAANSVAVSRNTLTVRSGPRTTIYRILPSGAGVQRAIGRGRALYAGVGAEFAAGSSHGVSVRVFARQRANRRPIRVDISTFVSPRRT